MTKKATIKEVVITKHSDRLDVDNTVEHFIDHSYLNDERVTDVSLWTDFMGKTRLTVITESNMWVIKGNKMALEDAYDRIISGFE